MDCFPFTAYGESHFLSHICFNLRSKQLTSAG